MGALRALIALYEDANTADAAKVSAAGKVLDLGFKGHETYNLQLLLEELKEEMQARSGRE